MIAPVQMSHYALLRVERSAHATEIEQAYRQRLAALPPAGWRRWLWLVATGESPANLQLARDILCHPAARARYDRELADGRYQWVPLA